MSIEITKKNSKAKKYLTFYILIDFILLIILVYMGFILKNLLFFILVAICTLIPALIKLYYSYLTYPLYVHISDQNFIFKPNFRSLYIQIVPKH